MKYLYDNKTGHKFVEKNGKVLELKKCTKCGKWHPVTDFYYHKCNKKDHLNSWCKGCMKVHDFIKKLKIHVIIEH